MQDARRKIVELLYQQSECNRRLVEREKQIADLERRTDLQSGAGGNNRPNNTDSHDLYVQLREAEEKLAFMYQKFVYVSARCQTLEKTCRDLLDSDANAQAFSSVSTVVCDDVSTSHTSLVNANTVSLHTQHMHTGQEFAAMQQQMAAVRYPQPRQHQRATTDGYAFKTIDHVDPTGHQQSMLGGHDASAYNQIHAVAASSPTSFSTSPRSLSKQSPKLKTPPQHQIRPRMEKAEGAARL